MDKRITALRRFALAITILNIFGHTILGFEQSILQLIVALATAYSLEIIFELVKNKTTNKSSKFFSDFRSFVDFLLPAHITGLAISMLLYANEEVWPYIFATAVAIGSKEIFRVNVNGKSRHFFNPSNTGIAITLLVFPWIGIAPPYQFTENVTGAFDWVIPGIILFTGSLLNATLTNKIPLILGWGFGFIGQGLIRYFLFGETHFAALLPVTGLAFLLFTFYMVTDPGTTPFKKKNQFYFGASVALVYGTLMVMEVVYTFFFALIIVCGVRGIYLYALNYINSTNLKSQKIQNNSFAKEAS
jgi:enediyne biosynthesis protein E5